MFRNLCLLCLLVSTAVYSSSCGTIIQGSSQEVNISSNPSSAEVIIDGQQRGQTPLVVDLKRKDHHIVRITLEGYQPYEIALARKVSGWVWGNIVFGGLIGLAVDAITGGMYKLNPEQVLAEMREDGGSAAVIKDNGLFITIVLQPSPEWEKIGQMQGIGE